MAGATATPIVRWERRRRHRRLRGGCRDNFSTRRCRRRRRLCHRRHRLQAAVSTARDDVADRRHRRRPQRPPLPRPLLPLARSLSGHRRTTRQCLRRRRRHRSRSRSRRLLRRCRRRGGEASSFWVCRGLRGRWSWSNSRGCSFVSLRTRDRVASSIGSLWGHNSSRLKSSCREEFYFANFLLLGVEGTKPGDATLDSSHLSRAERELKVFSFFNVHNKSIHQHRKFGGLGK